MTSGEEKDWADEIEKKIAAEYASHGAILAADDDGMISAAIRKAKADGVRWAADMTRGTGPLSIPREDLYEWADKIELGES